MVVAKVLVHVEHVLVTEVGNPAQSECVIQPFLNLDFLTRGWWLWAILVAAIGRLFASSRLKLAHLVSTTKECLCLRLRLIRLEQAVQISPFPELLQALLWAQMLLNLVALDSFIGEDLLKRLILCEQSTLVKVPLINRVVFPPLLFAPTMKLFAKLPVFAARKVRLLIYSPLNPVSKSSLKCIRIGLGHLTLFILLLLSNLQ